MENVLQINSSILGEQSVSKLLSDYAAGLIKRHNGAKITVRETDGLPHLTGETLAAFSNTSDALDAEGKVLVETSNKLIEEIRTADVLILGVPTYNFFIPSQLKSYLDFIARAGVTFKYTKTGPIGLMDDKRVYVINASGGIYHATGEDLIGPYIKKILEFVGIQDVHFVRAEGLALDQGANKDSIIAQAKVRLKEMMATDEVIA